MLSNPVVKREMNYVSFNSTPDFNAVKTGLLRFSSLKSNSIKLQERLDELLDHEVSKKVSGIILDSPQPRSIQKILVKNHKTFEQKLIEEKANQNTATNITRN